MKMNNKGFTMVELLVAMAIMGLLIIMAFPTIRAIQTNNTKTKYKEYGTSAISATKIYTDSYAEDLFDDEQDNEFKVVYFDELVRKDLIKDINISDSTCITESSVTVVKYKDDYSYCLHLVCKSRNSRTGDSPLYEENNRRGNCSKFTQRKVNYIYDTTKSKDAIDGDENYTVLNPSRLGFNFNANHDVFVKWNTKRDGTGKTYNPGDKLDKIEGDVDLYAITRKWEYYLHLNKGIADSGTISDNPHRCEYGKDCIIPDNKYTKEGYTFDGWSDGTNKYTNKDNVKTKIGNNIPGDGHKVYLTATFKIKSCTVTYSPNGGKFNSHANDTVQTVNYGSYFGDATDGMRNALGGHYNATKTGYHLEEATAWTDGSKTFDQRKRYLAQDVCDLSVKSNTTTLNANWKISTYKCAAGKYLPKNQTTCSDCVSGYYWPGGEWRLSTTANQGIYNCPSGYGNSAAGSSQNTQCYMSVLKNYYVKTAKASSATACPTGYEYPKNYTVYYGNTSSCTIKTFQVTIKKQEGIDAVTLTVDNDSSKLTQTVNYGTEIEINITGIKDYFQWVGWSDNITTKSRKITVKSNITLTAQARKNELTLKLYANGGTLQANKVAACPESIGSPCDSVCDLKKNEPGCTGNTTGLVYISHSVYDGTNFSTHGLRDHQDRVGGTLYMTRPDKTATEYWIIGKKSSTNAADKINENHNQDTSQLFVEKEIDKKANGTYLNKYKKGDVTIKLYAEWQ